MTCSFRIEESGLYDVGVAEHILSASMVAFIILMRVGKNDAAHDFALKSKNLAYKVLRGESLKAE